MRAWRGIAVALVVALLTVTAPGGAVAAASWPAGTFRIALDVERLAGPDRYQTAVAIARDAFPGWSGVDHVVVSSGEDRALADPLSAGALCWAYDAPLLLVTSAEVPPAVTAALEEIRSVNSTVTVTVVGGPVAVSEAVVEALEAVVGDGNVVRPWSAGDRYTTAAGVAELVSQVASDTARVIPARALVANGTTPAGFVDALAASAVSSRTGIPVLLVERDVAPTATREALGTLAPGSVIVVGGPAVVSDATYAAVGASSRWAGADRYTTAATVATGARNRGWLTSPTVGIAAAVPDALTGAVNIGRSGGPMLHVGSSTVRRGAAEYLHRTGAIITAARVFGGAAAVSDAVVAELRGAPSAPTVVAPVAGTTLARKARLVVTTGVNTTGVDVWVGAKRMASVSAPGYATVDLGAVWSPPEGAVWRIVARNPDGGETSVNTGTFPRYAYPAPTSIVVDKSDFRLYFFKDDVFVKSYPIAHGKPSTPTPSAIWRIDSKYYSDPAGVYGPRKMRLYRKYGDSYVRTGFLIHGTNQPWVIGTRASHGCIRMYNRDVLELYPMVPLGTIVQTRD